MPHNKQTKDALHSEISSLKQEISSLEQEIFSLKRELAFLKGEKADLELLMETNIEHSDYLEEDLLNKIEATLRESERRFRLISETIPVPIIVNRLSDFSIVYANEAAGSLFGYPVEELLGRSVTEFYNPADRQLFLDIVVTRGYVNNYEIQGRKSDNAPFWAVLSIQPLPFKNEPCLLNALHDMTERKLAEEERMRLATAVEQGAESIIITDMKGNIEYVNPAFEQTFGYTREDITGRNFSLFRSERHPRSFYEDMWNTIKNGRVWTGRVSNLKKDGALCEFETTISPIRDNSGSIINFVSINRDVTHEVFMEKQLRQAQKMEAIGTLAAGISHDFNNILAAIFGYVELAQMTLPEGNETRSRLDKVLNAAERAKNLVMQILTFCRQTENERKPLQISPIIKEALNLLRAFIPATIDIRQDIRSPSVMVLADPTQIHQVLMNLCTNAANAMREKGGVLKVIMEDVSVGAEYTGRLPGLDPGEYVKLSVCDTGHGIMPEIAERIFDPFFTTKKPGEGTGMGLAVVHGIITSHGGAIYVESEPEKGTSFYIYLPLISSQETMPKPDTVKQVPTGSERILVIDDEKDLLEIFEAILKNLGYKVVVETSSVNALEIFRMKPDYFDLIITDQTMPNMTGEELSKEIMRIRPSIPIIICTGYSELMTEEKALKIGIKGFLTKPFAQDEIARTIRQVFKTKG